MKEARLEATHKALVAELVSKSLDEIDTIGNEAYAAHEEAKSELAVLTPAYEAAYEKVRAAQARCWAVGEAEGILLRRDRRACTEAVVA